MHRPSHPGEPWDSGELDDPRRDVKSLAPACGTGSESALETWKRRERARAILNARDPRRWRADRRSAQERPSGG